MFYFGNLKLVSYISLHFTHTVDPDDPDTIMSSPAKRFYLPPSSLNTHQLVNNSSVSNNVHHTTHHTVHHTQSISSCSSPDHPSDSNSNHGSCDEDSGSEPAFIAHTTSSSAASTSITHPLSCDTRHGNNSNGFAFVKPRYVAPQSPLAAGVNSHPTPTQEIRKSTLRPTSYTFTPVKERS